MTTTQPRSAPARRAPQRVVVQRVGILLPETVYSQYKTQTSDQHPTPEEVMSHRLETAVDHTSTNPLYLDDSDRRVLERLVGRSVAGVDDALEAIQSLTEVGLKSTLTGKSGLVITLEKEVLLRLKSRVWKGDTLENLVTGMIRDYLRSEVGL